MSFVDIQPKNLILSALKRGEVDSNAVILRFFETKGEKAQGKIALFKEPKKVVLVNLLENGEKEIDFNGKTINIAVKPFEIVSLKILF